MTLSILDLIMLAITIYFIGIIVIIVGYMLFVLIQLLRLNNIEDLSRKRKNEMIKYIKELEQKVDDHLLNFEVIARLYEKYGVDESVYEVLQNSGGTKESENI